MSGEGSKTPGASEAMKAKQEATKAQWEEWATQKANEKYEEMKKAFDEAARTTGSFTPRNTGQPLPSATDDLVRQLVDALQGTKKGVVAPPSPFSGEVKDFGRFRREYRMYIEDRPSTFHYSDGKRIAFVLSWMKTGNAGIWADNYMKAHDKKVSLGKEADTWELFEAELKTTFKDVLEVTEAQRKIQNYQQGSQTAEQFFHQFENL